MVELDINGFRNVQHILSALQPIWYNTFGRKKFKLTVDTVYHNKHVTYAES